MDDPLIEWTTPLSNPRKAAAITSCISENTWEIAMYLSETEERIEKKPSSWKCQIHANLECVIVMNHLPSKCRVDWLKREHLAVAKWNPQWEAAADFQGYTVISKKDGGKGSITHKKLQLEGGNPIFSYWAFFFKAWLEKNEIFSQVTVVCI